MAKNKKAVSPKDDIRFELKSGRSKILSVKINNYDSGEEVNLALNAILKVVAGTVVSSALSILANSERSADVEDLKKLAFKLHDKLSSDTKEVLVQTISDGYARFNNKDDKASDSDSNTNDDVVKA